MHGATPTKIHVTIRCQANREDRRIAMGSRNISPQGLAEFCTAPWVAMVVLGV